jgi:hypothetical protein
VGRLSNQSDLVSQSHGTTTMSINVYNEFGIVVNTIDINDSIEYVDGRVYKGDKFYYKGVGIPYKYHHIHPDDMTDAYDYVARCDVFYIGNVVAKKSFVGKTGIFQEKYQTHFTDWIGACGVKELNIFENLYDEGGFEMNAVEVFEYQTIDANQEQYYLKVDYPEGRDNYLTNPDPKQLRVLLDYMIQNDWNFPWDKNCLSDINWKSKITDVADIFKSSDLSHKIGTVYTLLYSLYRNDVNEYLRFCEVNSLTHYDTISFAINVLILLQYNGVDVNHLYASTPYDTYRNLVYNHLVIGKNCGFCGVGSCKGRKDSNQSYGEEIRNEYIRQAGLQLGINKSSLGN